MMLKTIIIFTLLLAVNGSVEEPNHSSSSSSDSKACADKSESCKLFAKFCDAHAPLQETCPQTCGLCSNPCSDNNGGCNHFCSGLTEPVCTCRDGYQLGYDQKTCLDINECASESNPCSEESFCVNTPGSYSCQLFDCQSLGSGFKNYYKSNTCCMKEQEQIQSYSDDSMSETAQFEMLLNEKTADTQWPWMVQILLENEEQSQTDRNEYHHRCGGAIISENWIVTSAFCVNNLDLSELKVVIGNVENAQLQSNRGHSGIERKVIQTIVHPESPDTDIALLHLDESVKFDTSVQPINLPCGEIPDDGVTCYVTGFGSKDENRLFDLSNNLKEIALPIVSSSFCNLAYGSSSLDFNPNVMMCAGHIQGGEDACFGDGGSPLVCQRKDSCQWFLSGIVSTGKGCGRPGFPGIYSKIVYFEEWIRENVNGDSIPSCRN